MPQIIRSRTNKSIGDTLEDKYTIVGKKVISEPTARTHYDAPRLGIYDYEVVPMGKAAPVSSTEDARRRQPVVSFRRVS